MKIRKGFVSNSSSSSFTCDVCGETGSGMDMGISDFGISQCENGHIMCDGHKIEPVSELTAQDKKEIWLSQVQKSIDMWSNSDYKYAPKYLKESKDEYAQVEKLEGVELEESFEYGDGADWHEDYCYDSGFPEQECPICQFKSLMDSTLAEYVLKTQAKTREDFLTVFKSQFPNYRALQEFLKEG